MTAQTTGGYRCDICGMTFGSLSDLDKHTREKHKARTKTT
jgi:C2H2-type zinc finger